MTVSPGQPPNYGWVIDAVEDLVEEMEELDPGDVLIAQAEAFALLLHERVGTRPRNEERDAKGGASS